MTRAGVSPMGTNTNRKTQRTLPPPEPVAPGLVPLLFAPTDPLRADQDGEYLHEAHVVIADALAQIDFDGDAHDAATWILEALADKGWHLFNYSDAKNLLTDYILGRVR